MYHLLESPEGPLKVAAQPKASQKAPVIIRQYGKIVCNFEYELLLVPVSILRKRISNDQSAAATAATAATPVAGHCMTKNLVTWPIKTIHF